MFMLNQLIGFGAIKRVSVVTTVNADGSSAWGNFTTFNRSLSIPSGVVVLKIGMYQTSAITLPLKLAERTGVGAYTIVLSESFAHPGGGWADKTLVTSYLTTNGNFQVGAYMNATMSDLTSQNRSYKTGDLSGAQTGFTEDSGTGPAMRVTYA